MDGLDREDRRLSPDALALVGSERIVIRACATAVVAVRKELAVVEGQLAQHLSTPRSRLAPAAEADAVFTKLSVAVAEHRLSLRVLEAVIREMEQRQAEQEKEATRGRQ